ncbi:MAG: hypothetical protein K5850_04565 [Bacteroidales bacterium]|nr:hypothetical protein [Bacteroidales bacterium]
MIAALLISILASMPVSDTLSVTDRSAERLSPVGSYSAGSAHSAAAWFFSPYDSYTSASVSWERRGEDAPLLPEEGSAAGEGRIDIETLVRLDADSGVRGSVSYRNGIKKDVMWNSSSDYDIVRPYAVADSVGGDVRLEEYSFSGGYASRRGRLHYGVEGGYRALHEYRMVDPRPRNIVSDLYVRAGSGYGISDRYSLELSASYRRYSQSQNISFYNQKGSNSSVFHLTGLGNHFKRFEGGTSAYTSTRYAGNGVELAANLMPSDVKGWRAGMYYNYFDIVHHLPNQNEAPYTELYTRTAGGEVSYVSRLGRMDYALGLHAVYENRSGVESVIDNGSAGRFLELMRFAMYSSDVLRGGFDAVGELASDSRKWTIEASADYVYLNTGYLYPVRSLNSQGMDFGLKAGLIERWGANLLIINLEGGRYQSLGSSVTIPWESTIEKLYAFYSERGERFGRSSLSGGCFLRWERELSHVAPFFMAGARYIRQDGGSDSLYTTVTIGFNF